MVEQFKQAPFTFWVHIAVIAFLVIDAVRNRKHPWFLPAMVVYGTVFFWYTADYLYSSEKDLLPFPAEVVSVAFGQISFFLIAFRILVGFISPKVVQRSLRGRGAFNLRDLSEIPKRISQRFLARALTALIVCWFGILIIGIAYVGGDWPALIWPPLRTEKILMYPLTRVGGGASFFFNAVGYIHILICALFGVIAILGRGTVKWIAIAFTVASWPYFWFDRTRSKMLSLLLPGLTTFTLFGPRSVAVRLVVLALAGVVVFFWFGKVMEYRAEGALTSFIESDESTFGDSAEGEKRENESRVGQDMFKELCWINLYIEIGRYAPNWGRRYFAEIVNPIPRAIWPDKPMPGIDYSVVRGFGSRYGDAGVRATISTGMIGQGIVNFGRILGVFAAAFLFAVWVGFLGRLWCQRDATQRAFLFLIGLGLTLNTGRDLTLLVLFPFVFAYVAVRFYEAVNPGRKPGLRSDIPEKARSFR